MGKFIYNLTQRILKLQVLVHKKRLERLHKSLSKGSTKSFLAEDIELNLNMEEEYKKIELEKRIKAILKENQNNPEKLLEFIQTEGTDVFKFNKADIFLKFIGEEEGFIPPLNGINALFLNLFVNFIEYKKIVFSFKSKEIFILRPLNVDVYYMIHQLYLWYAFKMGMSGYELKNRRKFKKILATMNDNDIANLSLDDVLDMKDAIARDVDAIDFVVNLAKESETTQKLLNKLKDGQSVKL